MKTYHTVLHGDARDMAVLPSNSADLVVTSPPYPMVEMWDKVFGAMNPCVEDSLRQGNGKAAFELMHRELDKVWAECFRILKAGSIACVNIGDAVRTIDGDFQMYSNHARIISSMVAIGFTPLPDIIWRKPTNAPTKFMGSGMLPIGAYVTYEHEYILVLRKGGRRSFESVQERHNRRESAFFWEERNKWFSDVWVDLVGAGQELEDRQSRSRSAAFPFELAYRLACMYSVYGDRVFDPFLGTGTVTAAAIAAGRDSIGVEIDTGFARLIERTIEDAPAMGDARIKDRLREHAGFVRARTDSGSTIGHANKHYGFPVMSAQERDIRFFVPRKVTRVRTGEFSVDYGEAAAGEVCDVVSPPRNDKSNMRNGILW